MLKHVVKFENFANKVITILIVKLIQFIKRIVPESIKQKLISLEQNILNKRQQVIASTKLKLEMIKQKAISKKEQALEKKKEILAKVDELKKTDWKQKALEWRVHTIAFLKENPPKVIFLTGLAACLIPFKKLALWFKTNISFTGIGTYTSLAAIGLTATYAIYFNANKIKNYGRKPASSGPVYTYKRPEYYKQDKRSSLFTNIILPVYFKSKKNVTALTIDFNLITNYRQTLLDIEKHHFQIRDHLLESVEPIQAEFPLENEGREILKAKLKEEINHYLKNKNINGEVTEVQITYILGT